MWSRGWREKAWKSLSRGGRETGETGKPGKASHPWDVIVVGGGITGAGIAAEAARIGLKVLLVEAQDFSSGTSSRSTKLVHGGLRYLRQGQIRVTRESVVERERLMRGGEGAGRAFLGFWLTTFEGDKMPGWMFGPRRSRLYDALAGKWAHESHDAAELLQRVPSLEGAKVRGGYHYYDAQTDDARLTLRVLRQAVARGATAINYARAVDILKTSDGRVRGAAIEDVSGGPKRSVELEAHVVINATGVWADGLREKIGAERRLRPIRGSHLVLAASRLPVAQAVSMLHPRDGRAVFALPWEGVTIVGTTDVDHKGDDLWRSPRISSGELEYILESLHHAFPKLDLSEKDVRATWSGVRGVIDTGARDPSKESREHALWEENGLLTVTGGKLTTFRLMAIETLRAAKKQLPAVKALRRARILDELPDQALPRDLDAQHLARACLLGRHGPDAKELPRRAGGDRAGRRGYERALERAPVRRARRGGRPPRRLAPPPRAPRVARRERRPPGRSHGSGRSRSLSLGWDDATWAHARRRCTGAPGRSAMVLSPSGERDAVTSSRRGRREGETAGARGVVGGDHRDARGLPRVPTGRAGARNCAAGTDGLRGRHVRSVRPRERLVRPRLARHPRRRARGRRRRGRIRRQAVRGEKPERERPRRRRRAPALRAPGRVARDPRSPPPRGRHPGRGLRDRERGKRRHQRFLSPPNEAALGDAEFRGRCAPLRAHGQLATGAIGRGLTIAPTGSRAQYTSDGKTRFVPRLQLAGAFKDLAWAVRLGMLFRTEDDPIAGQTRGHAFVFGGAVGWRPDHGRLTIGPEIYGSASVTEPSSANTPVEAILGARYALARRWRVGLGAGPGLHRRDQDPHPPRGPLARVRRPLRRRQAEDGRAPRRRTGRSRSRHGPRHARRLSRQAGRAERGRLDQLLPPAARHEKSSDGTSWPPRSPNACLEDKGSPSSGPPSYNLGARRTPIKTESRTQKTPARSARASSRPTRSRTAAPPTATTTG